MLEESIAEQRSAPADAPPSGTPEAPVVVIEPSDSWQVISLRDLWLYRELLYFLIWRDLKVRYKQTMLGVAWVILQPLFMTIIFSIFLGRLVRVPSDGIPYPLMAYTGVTAWTFVSNAVVQSGTSLVTSTHLVTKIYFPRVIIPAAAVGARLLDFFVACVILIAWFFYYGMFPGANVLMFPVCVLLLALLALAIGFITSALNVRYRDVTLILPVAIQLWMFVSPIVYPISIVPARWLWLYRLNPMAGAIEGVRSSLLNKPFDWASLGISAAITFVLLGCSMVAFKRMERHFADIV